MILTISKKTCQNIAYNNEHAYTIGRGKTVAQVLKEDVRQRIIAAAKKEFLSFGYEDASMRRIALEAKVTVGNLYRYFLNKDQLLEVIVAPCFKRINHMIALLTDEAITFDRQDFNFELSEEEIIAIIEKMGEELFKIRLKMKEELMILMMDSRLSKDIKKWLVALLRYLIAKDSDPSSAVLAESFATSIFAGLQEIFLEKIDEEVRLKVIKGYLKAFMAMIVKRDYIGDF